MVQALFGTVTNVQTERFRHVCLTPWQHTQRKAQLTPSAHLFRANRNRTIYCVRTKRQGQYKKFNRRMT